MATNTQPRTQHQPMLAKFIESDFVDQLMTKFDQIFIHMNLIDRILFSKYSQFVEDAQAFKNSLLKFTLDAQSHLSVLKDNMASPRYQQQSDETKLKFIEERLNRINRETLIDYIHSCTKLIETSIALQDEYGTKGFKVRFVILHMLGFTAIGAAAGFAIGLALPFCCLLEVGVGAVAGAVAGLAYVIYQLWYKWDDRRTKINQIRDHLKQIHDGLVDVEKELQDTYKGVTKSQRELKDQVEGQSWLQIDDLHNYIVTTHDQFLKLEQSLLHVKINEKDK